MKRAMLLLAFCICALAIFGDDLASDRVARGVFKLLLKNARYGFGNEEAAFLIRTPNGLAFLHWRATDHNEAEWRGPIPRGTIAIAHTHPQWMSMPSTVDARTSKITGLPVYVITTSRIAKTTGGAAEVVSMAWDAASQ